MKRKNFIAALSLFSATPLLALAKQTNLPKQRNKGFKVAAGEGRKHGHIKLKGVNSNVIDVKLSGSDTNGDLAIFEQTSLSQGKGTPMHIHLNQDEIFYELEGEYKFKVGDDKFDLAKGDTIYLPKKVPHAWTQVSENGKMRVTVQPAGKLENFFVTMAALKNPPSEAEMAKIFLENDMQVVGQPLSIE